MRGQSAGNDRYYYVFFFNDTATTEIYTLSLHDALPICATRSTLCEASGSCSGSAASAAPGSSASEKRRSEEHTSELQSRSDLVCRLLLEKKKTKSTHHFDGNPFNLSTCARPEQETARA